MMTLTGLTGLMGGGTALAELPDSSDAWSSAVPVVSAGFAVSSVSLGSGYGAARGVLPVTPDDEGVLRLGPGSASSSLLALDSSW